MEITRRKMLQATALTGAGLATVSVPTDLFATTLPGFNLSGVNYSVINSAKDASVLSLNRILVGAYTSNDVYSLANAYVAQQLHLNSLGFDTASAKYLTTYKPVASYSQMYQLYLLMRKAGLNTSLARVDAALSYVTPSYYNNVVSLVNAGEAIDYHVGVATIMRNSTTTAGAFLKEQQLFPHLRVMPTNIKYLSEKSCFYMNWGGGYLAAMAFPLAATPLAVPLAVIGMGLWITTTVGGC